MGRLGNHKNVVTFIGAVTTGTQMMIVTKYYSRGSLEDYVYNRKEGLTEELKEKIAIDISIGLHHLHLENVVHRDIACRNILLEEDWTAVVSDFGYSRFFEGEGGQTKSDVGPIPWMAPESINERTYSRATDAWMYGALLSEMYTGERPFFGKTMIETIEAIKRGRHPRIPTTAPAKMQEVMKGVFQQEAKNRKTMEEIGETIER